MGSIKKARPRSPSEAAPFCLSRELRDHTGRPASGQVARVLPAGVRAVSKAAFTVSSLLFCLALSEANDLPGKGQSPSLCQPICPPRASGLIGPPSECAEDGPRGCRGAPLRHISEQTKNPGPRRAFDRREPGPTTSDVLPCRCSLSTSRPFHHHRAWEASYPLPASRRSPPRW
jgi:hypothetical protein